MDLVTGGSGFVGSYLARHLQQSGRDVRVFDIEPGEHLPQGVDFHRGDMREYAQVRRAVAGVDVVYHLAFVQAFSKRPEREKWDVDYGGTGNFLKASLEEGVKRFVHTSTVEVYSPFPPFPVTEDSPTDRPFGWYGRHKKACEDLCWYYHREHGLPLTMVRLPTICGRGYYVRIDLLKAFDWLLANRPVLWFGGKPINGDFIWIEDCVKGYVLCGTEERAVGRVFNISCREPSTAIEIIEALMEVAGNTGKIHLVPPRIAWPPVKLAARLPVIKMPYEQLQFLMCDHSYSIEKARRLLGYNPVMNAAQSAAELMKGYMEDRDRVLEKARNY
jgi:nucleoside-diphosphate-sugar epimerase